MSSNESTCVVCGVEIFLVAGVWMHPTRTKPVHRATPAKAGA